MSPGFCLSPLQGKMGLQPRRSVSHSLKLGEEDRPSPSLTSSGSSQRSQAKLERKAQRIWDV